LFHVLSPPQFFLREDDLGKSRADVTVPRLAELNAYVFVRNLGGNAGQPITVDLVKSFQVIHREGWLTAILVTLFLQVVVLVNAPLQKQLEINDWTHQNDVHFIAAGTHGLFGYESDMCPFNVAYAL
jgi:ubiquitin-activating enzyme E1